MCIRDSHRSVPTILLGRRSSWTRSRRSSAGTEDEQTSTSNSEEKTCSAGRVFGELKRRSGVPRVASPDSQVNFTSCFKALAGTYP
eukprot:2065547-Amphidinium_carterae.1